MKFHRLKSYVNNMTRINIISPDELTDIECSICKCKFTEEEGGLHNGYIGILPVSFCPTCFSGIFDMVEYFKGEQNE